MNTGAKSKIGVVTAAILCVFGGWMVRGWAGPFPNQPQLNLRNTTEAPASVQYGSLAFKIPPGEVMGFRIHPGDSFRISTSVGGTEIVRDVAFWPGNPPQVQAEIRAESSRLALHYIGDRN